jgi:hypothetical protein
MIHEVLFNMIEYFGKDVRRINHALKVYSFASAISRSEKLSQRDIDLIEMAALLHDIGIPEAEKKYNSCAGKYQELEGPPVARIILSKCNVDPDRIERICYLIGNHHTYSKIDQIDFQILVEADFLVNIFEDEMDKAAIQSVRKKYFKTGTGKKIFENMFLDY